MPGHTQSVYAILRSKLKKADETVNDSATVQNDDELFVPVAANCVYLVRVFPIFTTSTVAGFKISPSFPYSTFKWWLEWAGTRIGVSETGTGGAELGYVGSVSNVMVFEGILQVGSSPGNFQLRCDVGCQ